MVLTAVIILILVALDRAAKIVAEGLLVGKGAVEFIPNILGFRLLENGNTGAAFGLFSGGTVVLSVVTFIVVALLLYVLFFKKFSSKLLRAAVILITAGGIGNLYDRIVYGAVTDFLEFRFMSFPIFNVADCFVTIGCGLMLLYILISPKNEPVFVKETEATDTDKEKNNDEQL
ncbi:MAG: signal peptidase II [Ruminococcaceae bacterium]|nr:signal peptidase II [Oscillospiraceae bacterium]